MSTTAKTILWVVIAVVVIGGIWWWYSASHMNGSPAGYGYVTPTSSPSTAGPAQNPPGSPDNSQNNNGVSATNTSNAALQADLSAVDGQMNGFSSDNASMNQASNDQPVQQASL